MSCLLTYVAASRQKGTNVGNFKIELGARYDSRSVHLSFKTKIIFYLSPLRSYGIIHYCGIGV